MVAKNKQQKQQQQRQKQLSIVLETDRLKLQLLNAIMDRSAMALDGEKVRMENARLGMAIAQRDLDVAKGDLKLLGDQLAEKYQFNLIEDSVDWTTGEIRRGLTSSSVEEKGE